MWIFKASASHPLHLQVTSYKLNLPYHSKALNSLICADVTLRNCSLTLTFRNFRFQSVMSLIATAVIISDEGERKIKMDETFFTGYRKTRLRPTEVLLSIDIPFTDQVCEP